jgi:outer membrane protein assembly factor BamB
MNATTRYAFGPALLNSSFLVPRSSLLCGVVIFLAVCVFPCRARGDDWPRFLGPLGTSISTEKGILSPWPNPKIVWDKEVGIGYCMPVVSKGKLYHFDRNGKNARVMCLDARTAANLWSFEYLSIYKDYFNYNSGPRCSPLVEDNRVYTYGVEGMLHCLNADTGKPIWDCNVSKEFNVVQNFFGVGSTPAIEGNLLICQVGGSPAGGTKNDLYSATLKGNGSGIVAFDKLTGKVVYKVSDELASYASPVLATINGRRWCFVFARGGLVAFDPANGKIDFHFPWRSNDPFSVNASNPLVVGDQVFISETYGPGSALLKIKPGGYEVLRQESKKFKKSMQCHWMTPIHHAGYLYGSSGRHKENAELRCIELATGKVMWSEKGLTRSSLLMVDGHFICLGENGVLRLLKVNPEKYEEISTVELKNPRTGQSLLEDPCWAAPILSHGLLYVRGEGRIVCLELIPQKK